MRFDDLMYELRDWAHGAGWALWVGIGVSVVVLAVVAVVIWPTVRPKPKGQLQPLSTVVTTSTPVQTGPPPVPKEVKEEVMADLGVDDPTLVSVSWLDEEQNRVLVNVAKGGNDIMSYEFVQSGDGWQQK